jgi:hypothetical protein
MSLAQAAASAACLAIAGATTVQEVPYPALRERLLADHQRLAWPLAPAAVTPPR